MQRKELDYSHGSNSTSFEGVRDQDTWSNSER